MINIEKQNCCHCGLIDSIDSFWNEYKYKISSPLAVSLSICGAITGLLIPQHAIAGTVANTITNISIFFTSILLTKYTAENKHLNDDNRTLKNENRRLTTFQITQTNENSNPSTNKSIESTEPLNFDDIHRNNVIQNFNFPN